MAKKRKKEKCKMGDRSNAREHPLAIPTQEALHRLFVGADEPRPIHDQMVEDIATHVARLELEQYALSKPSDQMLDIVAAGIAAGAAARMVQVRPLSFGYFAPNPLEDRLVFRNSHDVEKPLEAILAGRNVGDDWIHGLVSVADRPSGALDAIHWLEEQTTWRVLHQHTNRAIKSLFRHDADTFKVEKCILQNVADMLRAWIVLAQIGQDELVFRRGRIVRLLGDCIVYGRKTVGADSWIVLFA